MKYPLKITINNTTYYTNTILEAMRTLNEHTSSYITQANVIQILNKEIIIDSVTVTKE